VMVDREEKITFCNEALTRLTGWRHDEIIGRNWFDMFMPEGSVSTRSHYATLLADQPERGRHQNRISTRSGELREICWTSSIIRSSSGDVIGVAGIGEDVTDQEREAAKILQLNANLEKFSIRLIQAQEQERVNLARELHDELGQRLALLKIDLYQLRLILIAPEAISIWENVDAAIVSLIAQIRVISVSLRPPALDYLGLESAIRQLLKRQFNNSTTTCVFEYVGLPSKLDPTIEIAVYRIVQECITNIVRHAEAGRVVVEINGGESGAELELIVRDNGSGFDRTTSEGVVMLHGGSSGLLGMQERVELLGGAFSAETAVGQGTRITVSLPLKSHA
jgi:PAS domain S-box-containing protein